MILQPDLIVPPSTPQAAPVSMVVRPTTRYVKSISLYFPPGTLGVIGVRVSTSGRQIMPYPSGWLHNSGGWAETLILEGPPYELTIEGYSDAIDYPHKIECSILMGNQ